MIEIQYMQILQQLNLLEKQATIALFATVQKMQMSPLSVLRYCFKFFTKKPLVTENHTRKTLIPLLVC